MKNILCFGDSNTYGYIPDGSGRYEKSQRWTGIMQDLLGDDYHVIEEGLCGRTTIFEDKYRQGRSGIQSIQVVVESHNPIDLLVVMLGTNDCKTEYKATAKNIASGVNQVIQRAKEYGTKDMKVLLVSPIHLGKGVGEEGFDPEFNAHSEEVSKELKKEYKKIAKKNQCYFFDAATVAKASKIDREHLDAKNHGILAEVLTAKVKNIVKQEETTWRHKRRQKVAS